MMRKIACPASRRCLAGARGIVWSNFKDPGTTACACRCRAPRSRHGASPPAAWPASRVGIDTAMLIALLSGPCVRSSRGAVGSSSSACGRQFARSSVGLRRVEPEHVPSRMSVFVIQRRAGQAPEPGRSSGSRMAPPVVRSQSQRARPYRTRPAAGRPGAPRRMQRQRLVHTRSAAVATPPRRALKRRCPAGDENARRRRQHVPSARLPDQRGHPFGHPHGQVPGRLDAQIGLARPGRASPGRQRDEVRDRGRIGQIQGLSGRDRSITGFAGARGTPRTLSGTRAGPRSSAGSPATPSTMAAAAPRRKK